MNCRFRFTVNLKGDENKWAKNCISSKKCGVSDVVIRHTYGPYDMGIFLSQAQLFLGEKIILQKNASHVALLASIRKNENSFKMI